MIKNDRITEIANLIYEKNRDLTQLLEINREFVRSSIIKFEELGLNYINDDYYVYRGKGGLKIHETPKGVRKHVAIIARKYNLSVVINDGILYEGDIVTKEGDGTIEKIYIKQNSQSLVMGGNILAPYAVVTVFKDNVMITKKLFIIPNNEYLAIVKMGSGNQFKTMMAQKMVMKRVLNGIYSLLGVTLDRRDVAEVDRMGEDMRVDDRIAPVEEETKPSTPQPKTDKDDANFEKALKIFSAKYATKKIGDRAKNEAEWLKTAQGMMTKMFTNLNLAYGIEKLSDLTREQQLETLAKLNKKRGDK